MTESPRDRATDYLKSCAAQIAPYWSEHYESKMPPQDVLDFFDRSVANLIESEPGLAGYFGIYENQTEKLTSELLDILIREAHLAVRSLQDAKAREEREWADKSSAERLELLEAQKAELLRTAPRADTSDIDAQIQAERDEVARREKEAAKRERLAYLRAKRDARVAAEREAAEAPMREAAAEREANEIAAAAKRESIEAAAAAENERYAGEVRAALQQSKYLVDSTGAITMASMNGLVVNLAAAVVSRWPEHGGQRVEGVVRVFLKDIVRALMQDVQPDGGSWDVRLDDGTVHRRTSLKEMTETYSGVLSDMVREQASPYFTYEQMIPWTVEELRALALAVIAERAALLSKAEEAEAVIAAAARSLESWQELHPAPIAAPYGVSPAGAERWCCDWLTHMGLRDASVTQQSNDGGIDVVSPTHIAQVKHYANSVSIAELRELAGVSAIDGRKPIFMTSGRYPTQAEEFANRSGMLLYRYDVETGVVEGCTTPSSIYLRTGFLEN